MACSTARESSSAELGELELTILLFVWRAGSMTVGQVRAELGPPYDDHAVRVALRRLESAGRLTHSLEGHALVYRPVEPDAVPASPAQILL